MHIPLPPCLAILATFLPTATAFYPYHYDEDSMISSNSCRESSSPPLSDALAVTFPIRRVSRPLGSRQNAYNIVSSNKPKQENSVAIDQDGGDLSYMVAVTIGSGKKEYHLLLDSAASNTWVMGQDCSSEACKTHNTFGTGDSSSLKTQSTPFSITYGTGSVSGTLATDTLHLGPLSPTLTFGLATNVSQEFRSYPMDGILGVGRGLKTTNSIDAPQIIEVLSTNRLISTKIYGLHLSRNNDKLNDGELNLGQLNTDRFNGDINYIDCIENETGFWEIPVGNVGVNGKNLDLGARFAIVDTGTSFILMPPSDALKVHEQIPGFKQDGETFSVPCDNAATLFFVINKKAYTIANGDWKGGKLANGLCRSNVIGRQTFKDNQWLVGDVFLKNVYAVFDIEKKKVGFGVKGAASEGVRSTVSGASRASVVGGEAISTGMVGSGLTGASQTAGLAGPAGSVGSASPTATAGVQPQGQKDSKSGCSRWSVSLLMVFGLFTTSLTCI
ncbi:rhizopuspepsin-1 precursor [Phaeosphaeriaceae sp. PMI808]|nr:rhizopuspepsin-1 precursor [Phaeosphaeriaceae sp. PMI808]